MLGNNPIITGGAASSSSAGLEYAEIFPKFNVKNAKEAIAVEAMVAPGEYVSIVNSSNLSEVMIYERTAFLKKDPGVPIWDGTSTNVSWYNPDAELQYLTTAEDLAGFAELVNGGNNFSGKTIALKNDIDLGHHEWTPIGEPYEEDKVGEGRKEQFKITIPCSSDGVPLSFSGIFDGHGHAIYGLEITKDHNNTFAAFFSTLYGATVRNIVFEDVYMKRADAPGCFATLFGYAESSLISNVIVAGKICGKRISGIGAIAKDTSFYECSSRVTLEAYGIRLSRIVVGGLVQQLELSDVMVSQLKGRSPNIFVSCEQNGHISIDARDTAYIWGGQMYGYIAHDYKTPTHGVIIDRCVFADDAIPIIKNFNSQNTRAVICGIREQGEVPSNYADSPADKTDLLDGFIGKTGNEISVTVIKATDSKVMNSIVIPGTVNTLESASGSATFLTTGVEALKIADGIMNLEPFFKFIGIARA